MAARHWTPEQKARQSALIRNWKPWEQSTGPQTPEGKVMSGLNAINYSIREVSRELARQNRALINYIKGRSPAPNWDTTKIERLLDDTEEASFNLSAKRSGMRLQWVKVPAVTDKQ